MNDILLFIVATAAFAGFLTARSALKLARKNEAEMAQIRAQQNKP